MNVKQRAVVILMLSVKTRMDHIIVHVILVLVEMGTDVLVSDGTSMCMD